MDDSQDDRLGSVLDGNVVHERRELLLRERWSGVDVRREQQRIDREVGVMRESWTQGDISGQ